MSIADAFAPAEAHYKAQVTNETWGHLAPEPRRKYNGFILFAHAAYGDLTVIDYRFKNLEDSPWFCEDLHEFINGIAGEKPQGRIYRFDGTYMKYKNGSHSFSGKVRRVMLA